MRKRGVELRACQCCGNNFMARLDKLAAGGGKFCSPACCYKKRPNRVRKSRREMQRQWKDRIKRKVMEHYGGAFCKCCGESIIDFLTLDHVENNGAEHRREIGNKGRRLFLWLNKNGFMPGFQVMCFNCNIARHWNGGVCPHKTKQQ